MKLTNAIKKLEKAGYEITTNGNLYTAYNEGHEIIFCAFNDEAKRFSSGTPSLGVCTYGLTLKKAMNA